MGRARENLTQSPGPKALRILLALDLGAVSDLQLLMGALQAGNPHHLEIAGIAREGTVVYNDATEKGADVVLLSPTIPGYSPEIVQRLFHYEERPILTVALGGELDPLDSVVCIEDTRELEFPGRNVSYLTTRPPSPEGEGAVTQRYLVQQSLRKRPDWIVLGEARGAEAWDFAQAGNTGHAIMGNVHANSARDAVERYRDLCLEAGENLRENVVLRGVVRSFRLVIYVELDARLKRRVVKQITEVTGNVTEANVPVLQDLFAWEDGELRCTGSRPYPSLGKMLDRTGCDYDQVMRGEGISPAWLQEAQRWA